MTPNKKTIQLRISPPREKTVKHPALEFFPATLFFLILALTALGVLLFSPLTPNFHR